MARQVGNDPTSQALQARANPFQLLPDCKLERHVGNAPIYSSLEDSHVSINTYVAKKPTNYA